MGEQVPLALGAIKLDQRVELRFGLDAFGNNSFAERRAHRDDRPHHFLSVAPPVMRRRKERSTLISPIGRSCSVLSDE